MKKKYNTIYWGIILSLLTLLAGEFMASSFGLYEKDIKAALLEEAMEHTVGVVVPGSEHEDDLDRKIFEDKIEAKKVASKAWVYLKRAHSHAEGMGAIALALVILIGHSALQPFIQKSLSLMIGAGAFAYPLCWFYAGVWMVDKGKSAAKAEIHYLAVSGVSLYMGGLIVLFVLILLSSVPSFRRIFRIFEAE